AILANGGYMPATPEAMGSLGKGGPTIYSNSALLSDPSLPWLIDRFALPRWLPFTNVFSIGDGVLAGGIFVLIVSGMPQPVDAAAHRPAAIEPETDATAA